MLNVGDRLVGSCFADSRTGLDRWRRNADWRVIHRIVRNGLVDGNLSSAFNGRAHVFYREIADSGRVTANPRFCDTNVR